MSLGFFKLGAVVNLLSHPVIIGLTNAAALIIGFSQLNKRLGVSMSRRDNFLRDIYGVLTQIGEAHRPTLLMGSCAFALIMLMKRRVPRWPNVPVAVAITTVISWQIGLERNVAVEASALADENRQTLVVEQRDKRALAEQLSAPA